MTRARAVRGTPARGASCMYKLEARALHALPEDPLAGPSAPWQLPSRRVAHAGVNRTLPTLGVPIGRSCRHLPGASHTPAARLGPERANDSPGTSRWTSRRRAMSIDLLTYRERARAHQAELDVGVIYLKPRQLAARWQVSLGTVYAIPSDLLPWKPFGRGTVKQQRRYHPADVEAFEAMDRGAGLLARQKGA